MAFAEAYGLPALNYTCFLFLHLLLTALFWCLEMHAAPQLCSVSLGFASKPASKMGGLQQLVHNVPVPIDLRSFRTRASWCGPVSRKTEQERPVLIPCRLSCPCFTSRCFWLHSYRSNLHLSAYLSILSKTAVLVFLFRFIFNRSKGRVKIC